MNRSRWRQQAMRIIENVLQATKGQDAKQIRAALRAAYPFGQRKYWPYKVWCDEIRRQTGKPRLSGWSNRKDRVPKQVADIPGQRRMEEWW